MLHATRMVVSCETYIGSAMGVGRKGSGRRDKTALRLPNRHTRSQRSLQFTCYNGLNKLQAEV